MTSKSATSNSKGFLHFLFVEKRRTTLLTTGLLLLGSIVEALSVMALFPTIFFLLEGLATNDSLTTTMQFSFRDMQINIKPLAIMFLIVAGISLQGLLTFFALRNVGYEVANMLTGIRTKLLTQLFNTESNIFITEKQGRFHSILAVEAVHAAESYRTACELISRLIQLVVYVTIICFISVSLALISLLIGVLVFFIVWRFFRVAKIAGKNRIIATKDFTTKLLDSLHVITVIKAMGREKYFLNQLEKEAENVNDALKSQAQAVEGLKATQEPFLVAGILIALVFAIRFLDMEPVVVALLGFVFFRAAVQLRLLLQARQILSNSLPSFYSIHETIQELSEYRESIDSGYTPNANSTNLELRNVTFKYAENTVLENTSIKVPRENITVFVGPSGSGKSTILNLFMSIQQPTSGVVLAGGEDLRNFKISDWRQKIGFVPQNPALIHTSIFENVALGDSAISELDVLDSLKLSGAMEFIDDLDDGIYSGVGEHGNQLSVGQRQRVALARALVRKPALLVLDEVTASVDSATAQKIAHCLVSLRSQTTILAATHQKELVQAADLVYSINNGIVSEISSKNAIAVIDLAI